MRVNSQSRFTRKPDRTAGLTLPLGPVILTAHEYTPNFIPEPPLVAPLVTERGAGPVI